MEWPNALFEAALSFGECPTWCEDTSGAWKAFLQAMVRYCNVMQPDTCECFCARRGCLPSRLFLARKLPLRVLDAAFRNFCHTKKHGYERSREEQDLMVRRWCDMCSLDSQNRSIYIEDAVRLEVFNRLDMAHTCCEALEVTDSYRWVYHLEVSQPSQEVRADKQYEDSESNEHLEMIMEAYRTYAIRHAVSDEHFLKGWWLVLDKILPDFDDESRRNIYRDEPSLEVSDRRTAMEKELLARNGYGGLDFAEVIRRHFKDYLDDEHQPAPDEKDETVSDNEAIGQNCAPEASLLPQDSKTPLLAPLSSLRQCGAQLAGKRRNSF